MSRRSIRWRIQLWHGALLAISVFTISILYFLHEKKLRTEKLRYNLIRSTSAIVPRFFTPGDRGNLDGFRARPPDHPYGSPPPGRTAQGEPPPLRKNMEGLPRSDPQRHRRPPPPFATGEPGTPPKPPPGAPPPPHIKSQGGRFIPARPRSVREILGHTEMYYIAYAQNGDLITISDNAPEPPDPPDPTRFPGETLVRTRDQFLEAVHSGPFGGGIVVGIPLASHHWEVALFGLQLFGTAAGIVILGMGTGWWMLGRETNQLSKISESSQRIAHGNLSERITLDKPSDEIALLADVLNDSFIKLENSFEQQVRFTADASHELRTPVSVIISKGQFALSKNRSEEDYRQAITTCIDSATHMKKMIESLLELARYDSGEAALNLDTLDLAEVVKESTELLQTLADKKQVRLVTDLKSTLISVDPHRIQQVCINLLANAIKHTYEGTQISITLYQEGTDCILSVEDEGCGINEKELPYLFDRFFRGKKSVNNKGEHTGLGLAITKAIILAHGGDIQASNCPEGGACFRIRFPITVEQRSSNDDNEAIPPSPHDLEDSSNTAKPEKVRQSEESSDQPTLVG